MGLLFALKLSRLSIIYGIIYSIIYSVMCVILHDIVYKKMIEFLRSYLRSYLRSFGWEVALYYEVAKAKYHLYPVGIKDFPNLRLGPVV